MKPTLITPDHATFLTEVKGRIQSARLQAGRAVNRELVLLYWDIRREIVEKQQTLGWGDAVVETFAADLRAEFPGMRGFSDNSVWLMRQFYAEHSTSEVLEQAVQELKHPGSGDILALVARELNTTPPWCHHMELVRSSKIPPPDRSRERRVRRTLYSDP